MLKRYFVSNIALMVLLNLLVKPIYIFAIDRNVQNVVGYEDYGLYAALLNLTIVFSILLDLGITSFNNKSVAERPERIGSYLPNILIAKGFLSLLFVGVVILVGLSLGFNGRSLSLLFLIALIQLLNSLLLFLRSNISAHHDFKIDSALSVADKLVMIGICAVLLFSPTYRNHFKIEWFIYAQLMAYSLSISAALVIIFTRYTKIWFKTFEVKIIKDILKKSMPFAILILLMAIYTRSDTVILKEVLAGREGNYENGVYASGYRILDALNMFGVLFASILLPMFSRIFSKNNKVKELVRATVNILIPISLVIVANSIFFNEEIMNYLYTQNTSRASAIYKLVIMAFPAFCLMYVYSTLLTAKGSLSLLIKISLVAGVLSVGLNLLLIPHYKALSLAWVALGVHWLTAILHILFSIKKTDIQVRPLWLFQFVFFFIVFCLINYALKYVGTRLILSIVLNMVIFVPFVFLIKLWKWQDLTKYFQELAVRNKRN